MTRDEACKLLKISQNASEVEIKKAFRRLAMEFHPDRNNSDDAKSKFIELHEAYSFLLNPKEFDKTHPNNVATNGKSSQSTQNNWGNQTDFNRKAKAFSQADYESARRAFDDAFERKSVKIYHDFFNDYKNGWKRKFVKFLAIFSGVFALLFVLDYFLPKTNYISRIQWIMDRESVQSFIMFEGEKIEVDPDIFMKYSNMNSYVNYSKTSLFGDFEKIEIIPINGFTLIDITPLTPLTFFPLLSLFLIFPLMSFAIEKPTFNFVFYVVHINIYVIPVLILFLMINSNRFLNLLIYLANLLA
jgi:hypothetical protein